VPKYILFEYVLIQVYLHTHHLPFKTKQNKLSRTKHTQHTQNTHIFTHTHPKHTQKTGTSHYFGFNFIFDFSKIKSLISLVSMVLNCSRTCNSCISVAAIVDAILWIVADATWNNFTIAQTVENNFIIIKIKSLTLKS
jgi:hypothetical protein